MSICPYNGNTAVTWHCINPIYDAIKDMTSNKPILNAKAAASA